MNDLNQSIIDAPAAYPAVLEIDLEYLERIARAAAHNLWNHAHFVGVLEPGDATRYVVAIVAAWDQPQPYVFASSFGPLYPWRGKPTVHPDYAEEHYVANSNPWTATVYALFLNMVAEHLEAGQ